MSLKSVISLEDVKLSPFQIGYLTAAAKDEIYEAVLKTFLSSGMSKAFLARRLGKKPEQITRWLGSPGNWTIETAACLLAAMGHKPTFGAQPISELRWENHCHPAATLKQVVKTTKPVPSPTSPYETTPQTMVSAHNFRIISG